MARLFDQPSSDDTTADDYDGPFCGVCGCADGACTHLWCDACNPDDNAPEGNYGVVEPDGPTCHFCGEPLPDGETDYCSSLCAAMAERDNLEDR